MRILEDSVAVAHAAAQHVVESARAAIARGGSFRIALSGGTTPERLYRLLAATPWRNLIAWERAVVLFTDERAVPPDDPDSNYRLASELLLDPLGVTRIERMRGEDSDLETAARAYETVLETPADLLVMGVGPDGHTASIFPGHAAVEEHQRRCVAVLDSPKPPPRRLTLTPRALAEAHDAIVLATGKAKAAAVADAFAVDATPARCPAALLKGREWFVDRAAAELLSSSTR